MITTHDIISIGCLAGELQTPVSQLKAIAEKLNIEPSIRINNVPHFAAPDVERLADHIRATSERSGSVLGDRRRIR